MRLEFPEVSLEYGPTETIDNALVDRVFKLVEHGIETRKRYREERKQKREQEEAERKVHNDQITALVMNLATQAVPWLDDLLRKPGAAADDITVTQDSEDPASAPDPAPAEDDSADS